MTSSLVMRMQPWLRRPRRSSRARWCRECDTASGRDRWGARPSDFSGRSLHTYSCQGPGEVDPLLRRQVFLILHMNESQTVVQRDVGQDGSCTGIEASIQRDQYQISSRRSYLFQFLGFRQITAWRLLEQHIPGIRQTGFDNVGHTGNRNGNHYQMRLSLAIKFVQRAQTRVTPNSAASCLARLCVRLHIPASSTPGMLAKARQMLLRHVASSDHAYSSFLIAHR